MFLVKLFLVMWRMSLLFKLNIEGLLFVLELEIRFRRNFYGGKFVYDERYIEVDLLDGMFIILLCIMEF